jgi:5-methylcytosine-specific restriction endonuclease McrA
MRNPTYYRLFKKKRCEQCKAKPPDVVLHVHHRNHKHWDDRPENLETLCEPCHVEHHRKPKRKQKSFDFSWMLDHYSVPGGKIIEQSKPKGILDHFMS